VLSNREGGQGCRYQEEPSQGERQGIRAREVAHHPGELDTGRPPYLVDQKGQATEGPQDFQAIDIGGERGGQGGVAQDENPAMAANSQRPHGSGASSKRA
jgi:hypothetical protein